MRFTLEGDALHIEPERQVALMSGLSAAAFGDVLRYFAGSLPALFRDPSVRADRAKEIFHYRRGADELWLDGRRGSITRLKRAAPGGGFNEIEITEETFRDGLWLPVTMGLHNTESGWTARLTFSNSVINDNLP